MPWRNPENWLSAELMAPVLSFVLALLGLMHKDDKPNWKRTLVYSAMCGLITFSFGRAVSALGMHGDWKYAIGGCVGLLGVDFVRELVTKAANKKVDKE